MGRGRAKAKQTKVARQLKYNTGDLDVTKLSVELGANGAANGAASGAASGAAEDGDDRDERDDRHPSYGDDA